MSLQSNMKTATIPAMQHNRTKTPQQAAVAAARANLPKGYRLIATPAQRLAARGKRNGDIIHIRDGFWKPAHMTSSFCECGLCIYARKKEGRK